MMTRSKIQQQVLVLYKSCMRAAQSKPGFTDTVRYHFKKDAAIPRTEVMRIEHLLRQGQRKLKMMKDPFVSGGGRFMKD